ncbi:MAG: hypothetical protein COA94_01895 [Rickettsiales bacterium]|nr:MAG: hypothetical protein COA94_01895 [Rickettsiales bacterium]
MAEKKGENEEEPLTPDEAKDGAKGGDKGAKGEDGENAEDPASAKKKKIKKILIILAPILIIALGTLYFFLVIKAPKHDDAAALDAHSAERGDGHGGGHGANPIKAKVNTYLDIDPITVSLLSTRIKKEYLKLDLTLRLSSEHDSTTLETKMPIIKDALITFLKTLRKSDFNSSSSTIYLKEEISKRINKIAAPIMIKEVLFQEITVN